MIVMCILHNIILSKFIFHINIYIWLITIYTTLDSQLEFRFNMKIDCVHTYIYIFLVKYLVLDIYIYIHAYNIHIYIYNIYIYIDVCVYIFSFLFLSSIFLLLGYLGSCSEPLLRRGEHTGILELFFAF